MNRLSNRYGRTQAFFIFVALLIIGLLSGIANADTNLAVVCPNADAEGQGVAACPYSVQRFDRVTASSLVRACASVDCAFGEMIWVLYGNVASNEFVEVCTADKPIGEIVGNGECAGDTGSTWGAMARVAPSEVAQHVDSGPTQLAGTFDVSPAEGLSPLDVTVTWDIPEADSCVATGAWSGAKAASGSEVVTLTADSSFTIDCEGTIGGLEGDTSALLSWSAPTQNTDGSSLTDLAGFRVFYGVDADELIQVVDIDNPGVVAYTVENLTPGTWFFGVKAVNESGVESALSNIVSKMIVESVEPIDGVFTATRTVDVTTQPQAPVLTVLEPVAGITQVPVFAVTSSGNRSTAIAGFVPAGTACVGDRVFGYRGFGYHLVPREAVTWWDTEPKDVAAPCFDAH